MWEDIVKRPFITAGMVAFTLMIPLAVTSTKGWIRRLGRRWQLLHRLVYFSAAAACLHFIWKVKVAVGEPVYYAAILGVLLRVSSASISFGARRDACPIAVAADRLACCRSPRTQAARIFGGSAGLDLGQFNPGIRQFP